jgi:hypothetical protein
MQLEITVQELVDEFDVRTDAGTIVRLYIFQDIIDAGTFQDPHATIRGLKRIVTEDGDAVNFIDENHFHIVARREDAVRI